MPDTIHLLIAINDKQVQKAITNKLTLNFPNTLLSYKENGANALLDLNQEEIDIAILHHDLPLLTAIEISQKCTSKTKLILVSDVGNIEMYQKSKECGFLAYLSLDDIEHEIDSCLRAVMNNSCFISQTMIDLIKMFGELSEKLAKLSPTEILFLSEVKEGKNYQEISDKLVLSSKSINKITSSISEKLDIPKKEKALVNWTQENKSIFN